MPNSKLRAPHPERESKMTDETEIKIIGMAPTFEAFGMIIEYLSETDVFRTFDLSAISDVVRRQLADGHNLAAFDGKQVLGYAGWLHTTEHVGSEWVENRAILKPLPAADSDAVALTVFAVSDKVLTARLIRGARELNKGKRVFFKRGYDGVVRPSRKQAVLNFTAGSA